MNTPQHKHYFLVMGPPQHGKSTTSGFLSTHTEGVFGSTSSIVYEELAREVGKPLETLRLIPKEVIRPDLVRKGNELCAQDKAFLVKQLVFRGFNIIDGIRRIKELAEVERFFQESNLAYTKLWIHNPNGPVIQDNTELDPSCAHYIIENDGTFEQLESKVLALLQDIRLS